METCEICHLVLDPYGVQLDCIMLTYPRIEDLCITYDSEEREESWIHKSCLERVEEK